MARSTMTTKDDFTDDLMLRKYLATQLVRGRMALILGAGVSVPFGLPPWKTLANRLLKAHSLSDPSKPKRSPELQVEWLRHEIYEHDPDGFIAAVHDSLYRGVNTEFNAMREMATLAAIAAMVMASRRGSVAQVVTLNFDDLLEIYLSYHGFVTSSMYREQQWAGYADVTIYHPHGLIPRDLTRPHSTEVVLDRQAYMKVVGDAANPWRQLLLTLMRQRTCLFIGISGEDVDLDSVVQACGPGHAIRRDNTAYWGVTFSTRDDPISRAQWESRGVFYKRIQTYDPELPDFLFGICQDAAAMTAAGG